MDKQVGNRTQNLGHQSLLTRFDIMNRQGWGKDKQKPILKVAR